MRVVATPLHDGWSMRAALLALPLILPSCVIHEEVVSLDRLDSVRMLIVSYGTRLTVEMESGAHPCPILAGDTRGVLRNATTSFPLTVTRRGGEDRSIETGECFPMELELDPRPPTLEDAELVISDSSLEAVIDLGGALSAPSATLVPAGPWELAGNHTYRVALPQRLLVSADSNARIDIIRDGAEPISLLAGVEDDELVFSTNALPTSGTGRIVISPNAGQYISWDCTPLTTNCSILMNRTPLSYDITFVP